MTYNRREWMAQGSCSGKAIKTPKESDKIFFQDRGRPQLIPGHRALCKSCSVLVVCLDFAVAHDLEGVWGNTTKNQRDLFPPSYVANLIHRAIAEGWYENYLPVVEKVTHLQSEYPEHSLSRSSLMSQDEFQFDFEFEEYQQKIEQTLEACEVPLAV